MSSSSAAKLLALLLVLAILVLAGWLTFSRPGDEGTREAPRPDEARAAAPAQAADATLDAPPAPAEPPVEDETRLAGASGAGRAALDTPAHPWNEEATVWIEGTVVVPSGAPADDELTVVAERDRGGVDGEPVALLRAAGEGDELARAPVQPDGAFRLALAPGTRGALLRLDARYLYLEEPALAVPEEQTVLEPRLGALIAGRLAPARGVDPDELRGVEVGLRPTMRSFTPSAMRDRSVRRESEVDDELRFELRGVVPGRKYALAADCDDHAARVLEDIEPRPGERLELTIEVRAGGRVSGEVRDDRGEPIEGAEVTALSPETLLTFSAGDRDVSTGADGRFELRGIPPGKVRVSATHDSYARERLDSFEIADGEHRGGLLLVLERGRSIAGTVAWPDGAPAPGASVELVPAGTVTGADFMGGGEGIRREVVADAEGRFATHGLARSSYRLTARAERQGGGTDGADEEHGVARLDDVGLDGEPVALVLGPRPVLAGRVVESDDDPVLRFELEAAPGTANLVDAIFGDEIRESFATTDGAFELAGLLPGAFDLYVTAEGYGTVGPLQIEMPRSEPLVVTLAPAAVVRGVVLAPDGAPVGGATVRVKRATPTGGLPGMPAKGPEPPRTTAGEGGRFELEGVTAGSTTIVAEAKGWASSKPLTLQTGAGAESEHVTLALRAGARLTGEVFGNDGEPADGVLVTVQVPGTADTTNATTDDSGRFELAAIDPGSYQVVAILSMGTMLDMNEGDPDVGALMSSMKWTMVELVDGETTHVVLGKPPEDPVTVRGRVTAGGAPVDALVSFVGEGTDALAAMKMTDTDDEGRYELRLDAPGRYLVSVQQMQNVPGQQNSIEFVETVPSDATEHVIDLELPGGSIRGRVVGADGEPAAGARITLSLGGALRTGSFTGGQYTEAATGDDGTYSIEYLRAGSYDVAAGGLVLGGAFGGSSAGASGRSVRTGIELREGQTLTGVDFRLGMAGTIAGKVLDATGAPVASATVFVRDESGFVLERLSFNATDDTGAFRYGGLGEGRYTVSARADALASPESAAVRVRPGETSEVTLRLDPGTMLLVRCIDEDGADVRARVMVTDEAGRRVNGMTSFADLMGGFTDGGFDLSEERVGPLPPGRYFVEAFSDDGSSYKKPVQLSGQPVREIKLRVR